MSYRCLIYCTIFKHRYIRRRFMRILTTGDIHIGGHIDLEDFVSKSSRYIIDSVISNKANYFIINGDTTHKAGIKGDSIEFKTAFNLLSTINSELALNDCKIIVLMGTESHDGRNMKSIVELIKANGLDNDDNITYIDSIDILELTDGVRSYRALFIPEPYYPTYDAFKNVVEGVLDGRDTVDLTVFHLMLDVAIPQYKQVNSQYGLNRSLVVDLRYIQNITNIVAFGSHFHAEKRWGNVHYVNTFVNYVGQTDPNGNIGLKLFELDGAKRDYKYTPIPNPHTTLMYSVVVDVTSESPDVALERVMVAVNDVRKQYDTTTDWIQIHVTGRNDITDIATVNTVFKVLKERGYNVKKSIKKLEQITSRTEHKIVNNISDDSIGMIVDDMIKSVFGKAIGVDRINNYIFNDE